MKYEFKTEPYAHQKEALLKSWNQREYALFMEMGTGKAKVLIDNMAILYGKGAINGAVIVAPKGVYRNWSEREIPTHLPETVPTRIGVWNPAPRIKEIDKLVSLFDICDELKILVMNVEAFSTRKGVAFAEKFILSHKTLLVIDESTTIKNRTAIRTKNIVTLGRKAKYRRILTGSPITKSPLDLFSQATYLHDDLLEC